LQQQFFEEIPSPDFYSLPFESQMMLVDNFIYRKITWKESYPLYNMVGLLVTPAEVIGQMAGDCQGQAAVTSSLLLSMGIKAWVVETAFHWWTHAEDNITGRVHNLNVHGHGGSQGNVLPQPIDFVYTRPPAACSNCSDLFAYNRHGVLFAEDPFHALMKAFTGAHILVRSSMTIQTVPFLTLMEMILGLTILITMYSSYFQDGILLPCCYCCAKDSSPSMLLCWKQFFIRFLISLVVSTIGSVGMCIWASVYYPISFLHIIGICSFGFTFISSDEFNNRIQS